MNIWVILMAVFAAIAIWSPWWGPTFERYRFGPFLVSWLFYTAFVVESNGGLHANSLWVILQAVFAVIAVWSPWWNTTFDRWRLGPFLLSWFFYAMFMVQKNGGFHWQ
jgi:hypothetical protein